MFGLLLVMALLERPYGEGWLKPRFFHCDTCEACTFRDGSKGFAVKCTITKAAFDGKVPEIMDFYVCGPQPIQLSGNLDEERVSVSVCEQDKNWLVHHNMDNEEMTLILYYDKPVNWKCVRVKVVGRYKTENQRQRTLCTDELFKIKGIVGAGVDKEGFGYVAIADCMPNIRGIVKRVRAIVARYKFKVKEIELREGYDFILEKQ